jgi:hypothetical protein
MRRLFVDGDSKREILIWGQCFRLVSPDVAEIGRVLSLSSGTRRCMY